jgi:hypothetical protein
MSVEWVHIYGNVSRCISVEWLSMPLVIRGQGGIV